MLFSSVKEYESWLIVRRSFSLRNDPRVFRDNCLERLEQVQVELLIIDFIHNEYWHESLLFIVLSLYYLQRTRFKTENHCSADIKNMPTLGDH